MDNSDLFICIDHVAIAYPDIDAALVLHRDRRSCLHMEKNEEQGVAEAMLAPVSDPTPEMTRVQLIARSTRKRLSPSGWRRIAPACTTSRGVWPTSMQSARPCGARHVLLRRPKIGTGGSRINFMHTPDRQRRADRVGRASPLIGHLSSATGRRKRPSGHRLTPARRGRSD